MSHRTRALFAALATAAMILTSVGVSVPTAAAAPAVVTLVGDLQSELGCAGDWDPACPDSALGYDADDDVWRGDFALPAGTWEYKVAIDGSWAVNYGAGGALNGGNLSLTLDTPTTVTFLYSERTHWVRTTQTPVAVAVGSFQSELGCPGDWQPDCLRSWLQDPDGDGVADYTVTGLPAAAYEAKVAIGESWSVNYGAGGAQDGANIPFVVKAPTDTVTFSYAADTHVLSITVTSSGPSLDGQVWFDGLRHDSRSDLYRTPGGVQSAGTPVTIRLRTFHGDVSSVGLRLYSLEANAARLVAMTRVAADVSCAESGLAYSCDYWAATVHSATPDNLWYRFVVGDGAKTVYYADNTPALDGGVGRATDGPVDQSYALMFSVPGFSSPAWARDAVVYQIFPDRFRSGRSDNNPDTGDVRYDDPVLALPWGTAPEGYCRNYAGADATTCPSRWGPPPAGSTDGKEAPRGRDYQGGDLKGVDQKLDYLKTLGVTTIYLNPVFDAGSNHAYDTQDYTRIDPYFGTQKDFDNLVKHARQRGMRVILDGVFNHLSSDSPFFDRYRHYETVGACESVDSPWRSWFSFTPQAGGPCAGPSGPHTMTYAGWFGFDSIPVLTKSEAAVQAYFLTAPAAIAKLWLQRGAAGWRMDVSGDASFPAGYWETFRASVKATKPDALTISETWQKDSTLLRMLRGDRLDTTMNYRFRDAVLGLLTPAPFDSKGFADSGRQITPTEFRDRMLSQREDYPDAAYQTLMNLLDSHDTERLLWTMTEGSYNRSGREAAAALAVGKQRVRLASLIQFTVPGMPTVYYGDEVGLTGADDPDDRRAYPWSDRGGVPDQALYQHYSALAAARRGEPALTQGDLRFLLADDGAGTLAYARRTASRGAVVALNVSDQARTVSIPVAGVLPEGTTLRVGLGVGVPSRGTVRVSDGALSLQLPARGAVLLQTGVTDLAGPGAPVLAAPTEGSGSLGLTWAPVLGAAGYHVYLSPVSGGGYVRVTQAPVTGTAYQVGGLVNTQRHFVVVKALDSAGNESVASNEVSGIPQVSIGWANLQWPPTLTHTISATNRTELVYGQIWVDGLTGLPGPAAGILAQVGYGPVGSDPAGPEWAWEGAGFNGDRGNNDEYAASLLPGAVGSFDYLYRYSATGGATWVYAGLDGLGGAQRGRLLVVASADTTAPGVPGGLRMVTAGPSAVSIAWDATGDDVAVAGYEVGRRVSGDAAHQVIGWAAGTDYTDSTVTDNTSYEYVVRAVDSSLNRSAWSQPVTIVAAVRTVSVSFVVTVPESTDGTGRTVHIAGSLDRLDGGLPQWNPGGVALTRVDATHWRITLTGKEGTQLEYKYALGSWDYVEKDGACGEIANRQLTLTYGASGQQQIDDVVLRWRNVSPCGN